MTCIVGVLDKENGGVWVGGDSLGSNGHTGSVYNQSKVFRNKSREDVVIGSTGSFRCTFQWSYLRSTRSTHQW